MTPSNTGVLNGQTLGDYELLSLLGAGGMAEVYRARDVALGREVAVKVLPASLATDPGYVERFRDEARRVATLDHPNVVPVYHYGEEHGLLYLVMPILKESLRDRMAREGIIVPSEAGRIVVQVAAALDAAHTAGIVHRDVKPENILLNADGKAHLTDFGISREMAFLRQAGQARTLAATGLPVGTPEYMAPEQLRGGDVDQRADIYALGAVLYELLTGTVPFDGPTPYEVAALVLTAPLAPPSVRNDMIWPDLDHVVMKALDRDAANRYPDARGLAIAVRNAVLHRDDKMTRVTIPASTYLQRTIAPQGLVLTLPTSGSLNKAAAPLIAPQLNLPSTMPQDTPTESISPFAVAGGKGNSRNNRVERWARSGLVPRNRTWLFVVASVLLVVLLIGTGWSVGMLQGLINASGATSLPGIGSIIATDDPTSTSTANGTATATGGTPGTSDATANAQATTPPLPANPTNTPQPMATATTAPPPALMYGDIIAVRGNPCTATQTISNPGSQPVSWQWANVAGSSLGFYYWTINGGSPRYSSLPNDKVGANSTETVKFNFSCKSGQTYTVTITDSTGMNQLFPMNVP